MTPTLAIIVPNEAEVSDYELRVYPRPKTLMDIMAEVFGGKDSDNGFVSLGITGRGSAASKFMSHPTIAAALEAAKMTHTHAFTV